MNSSCSHGSSGSDASMDEKKMRRRISNRESARRSRMKKQKHLQDLTTEMGKLERERAEISQACSAKTRSHLALRSENDALLSEKVALTDYLNSIEAAMGKFKECSEAAEPCLVHGQLQQITTSSAGI